MYERQTRPKYKPRPVLYLGVTMPMWSGALAVTVVLAVVLYCLLTHRIPI
ncbi:MAG: hypothetical protein L0211_07575 [Planctomycetaceae bacterium]|nr:hypothetical protein [Planctomycetaceae bacterium]